MDLCTGGHLGDMLLYNRQGYLEEGKAKVLVKQLLSALAHIHSRGICHRDIKLQNILMEHRDYDTAQIKLTDFGFGIRFRGILPLHTRCGTPYTTAPEVYRESYDERCDVWSAGVVAYILLSGHRPFVAVDLPGDLHNAGRAAMITSILMGRYHFDHPPFRQVSVEGINFIRAMLAPDYRLRWTAAEALKCSWLSGTPMTEPREGPTDTALSMAVSNLRRRVNVNSLGTTGMVAVAFGKSQQEATTLRSLFQSFDVENAGYLTRESFRSAMHAYSPDLSTAEVDQLFKAIDVDYDNTVSFTEFLAATIDPRSVNMEDLAKAFRLIDADNKGYITVEDICRVLAVPDRYAQRLRLQRSEEKEDDNEGSAHGITLGVPSGKGAAHHGEDISKSGLMDFEDSRFGGGDAEDTDFVMILEKATQMIEAADQNNDGKISYSEFIVAMTGASDTTLIKSLTEINETNEGKFFAQ
jgi:calcium-dependent protein kinase